MIEFIANQSDLVLGAVILALLLLPMLGSLLRIRAALDEATAVVASLSEELAAQRECHVATLEVLEQFGQRLNVLAQTSLENELRSPMDHSLDEASRLAQCGIDPERLAASCGLSEGEAELMVQVQGAR